MVLIYDSCKMGWSSDFTAIGLAIIKKKLYLLLTKPVVHYVNLIFYKNVIKLGHVIMEHCKQL